MDTAVIFDIDGVLIDSYQGIKVFYQEISSIIKDFDKIDGEVLFYYEMYAEGLGVLRSEWWPRVMCWLSREKLDELIKIYWEYRMKYSKLMPGTEYTLQRLKEIGVFVGSVSYKDDISGLKRERIKSFGLDKYFDEIIIVGEDFPSRSSGVKYLMEKYGFKHVFYIDDKPGNLWRMKKVLPRVLTILYRFQYVPSFPWNTPYSGDYTVHSLPEIIGIVEVFKK